MQANLNTAQSNDQFMRDPSVVMDLRRLGSFYPYKLSFMRKIIRKIMVQKWKISIDHFNLNDDGYGEIIYDIRTPKDRFHFAVFSNFLDPNERTDRVIAEQWDITLTLRHGKFDQNQLEMLRNNVPLQEKGRMSSNTIVLSRANRSSRNFDYVIGQLSSGQQPSIEKIKEVGYIYRTTAVYGSGKFGMADWEKVRTQYKDFSEPFSAEMFSCFMIRQFSFDQVEHIARIKSPKNSVALKNSIKRNLGIGNATGLGMAPFLIKHPLLINNWIEKREKVLCEILKTTQPDKNSLDAFLSLAQRAFHHLEEIVSENKMQNKINKDAAEDLKRMIGWISKSKKAITNWTDLIDHIGLYYGVETQEIANTILIEIYPDIALDMENDDYIDEKYELMPKMSVIELQNIIEEKYKWALKYNFKRQKNNSVFWYRSEEKMEPRLGQRGSDEGAEKEMLIGIAKIVSECYKSICSISKSSKIKTVGEFVFAHPEYRKIIRRIQTLSRTIYGEIQANLLEEDVMPIHLLRCKLSFFGVGKFDPKSRLWVRNTMFQGAPIIDDIADDYKDDWFFPTIQPSEQNRNNEIH